MRSFYTRIRLLLLSAALFLTATVAHAQTAGQLNGFVVDIDGAPVAGATVFIEGTDKGVMTDSEGAYSLSGLKAGDKVLFDCMGYQRVEHVWNGSENIRNIVLRQADVALDEVVVVGYGVQKKVSVIGAISSVAPKTLESKPAAALSTVLGGTMPGIISRQSTGEPGNDYASIFIRGMATWQDKAPLIMVDGIERDLNLVNPQEIDSFTILKDASATAVYGVRGANGVILITTKKGKLGKPKVTLRTEHAVLQGLRFPKYIDGYESASLMNEAVNHATGGTGGLPWTEDDLDKFKTGSSPYLYPNVNWIDECLNKVAYQTMNNLNITGGNEIIRYFMNVGYTSQGGLFKEDPTYAYPTNTKSDRYNFRLNTDVNIAKNLVFSLGLGAVFQDKTYPGSASNTIFAAIRQNSPISMPVKNPDGTPGSGPSAIVLNPWALTTQSGYSKQFISTVQSTAVLNWDLSELVTPGLSVAAKFSYDMWYANYANRFVSYGMKRYMGTDEDGNDLYNVIREQGTMGYSTSNSSNRAYYYDASVNYTRTFADRHNVSVMLLFNRRDYKDLTASSSIKNLPYRQQGLAGRFTYDFAHRYMTEFNFGYNGSENFAPGKRYGFFPSTSLGWVITEEPWLKPLVRDNVYLKLRGSYGVVGNDRIGGDRFLYISTVNYTWGRIFGVTQDYREGIFEGKIAAENVTWEKSYKTDIGLDLRLFKESLTLQLDWFNEDRRDILLSRGTIPIVTGIYASTYANLGAVNNRGLDMMAEYKFAPSKDFYMSFYANMTYAKNKIIEDDTAIPLYNYQNSRGHSIDQPFGYVALGLFQSEEEIASSPKQTFQTEVRPGDVKYKDLNNDGVIDAYDRTFIGYARTPEIMYGFGLALSWKNFDFSLGFTGAGHTSLFLTSEDMWPYSLEYPRYNISREYYDHRWHEGADNSKAKYPAVINGNSSNNYQLSTLYMRDASYLKLKNAEIGYRLPQKTMDRIRISGIRFFLNGINLLCFDKLGFVDPEVDGGTGNYPQQRTINLGVQVDF